MTTSRSRLLIALTASCVLASQAIGQAARTGWTMSYSDQEELQKLIFVAKGETHGEVYFRCRIGDGWIFLVTDVEPDPGSPQTVTLESASVVLRPSFRIEHDEVENKYYFDAAIPSNSRLFDQMRTGNSLVVNSARYPVETLTERKSIANFVTACGGSE